MSDSSEMYVTQEERDPLRLDSILRYNTQTQETPVMLVQMTSAERLPQESGFPSRQRRTMIINTAGTENTMSTENLDPLEKYFRSNNPNLRMSLLQEEPVDELTSRRKTKMFDDQEQTVLMLSNQNAHWSLEKIGEDEQDTCENVKQDESHLKTESAKGKSNFPLNDNVHVSPARFDVKFVDELDYEKFEGKVTRADKKDERESKNEDWRSCNNTPSKTNRSIIEKNNHKSIDPPYKLAYSKDRKSPLPPTFGNTNKDIAVRAATYASQITPFEQEQLKAYPSSRVKVMLMVDEWGDKDSFEDTTRREEYGITRKPKKKGAREGNRFSDESAYADSRNEIILKKSLLQGKGKEGRKRESDGYDGEDSKYGGKTKSGIYRDKDLDGNGDNRGKRSRDKRGSEGRTRSRPKIEIQVEDDSPVDKKYSKGKRGGDRPKDAYDGDNEDGSRYGDKRKPKADDDFANEKYNNARQPGRSNDPDRRRGKSSKSTSNLTKSSGDEDDRLGKPRGKGGQNQDPSKYRMVNMPKSATMLNTRRRYHVQIIDHEMKEPWFNSCFNISKENNVDFNYTGPVKITPYYISDSFH